MRSPKSTVSFFFAILLPGLALCNLDTPVLGNWAFEDCILAQFSMNITIYDNPKNLNETKVIVVPATATVDTKQSTCGNPEKNEDQILGLTWKDTKFDSEVSLEQNILITFRRNLNSSYYGVERFFGRFVVETWKVNGTDYNKTIEVDSLDVKNLLFHTPLDRSFTCKTWGTTKLQTKATFKPKPQTPVLLANSTVQTSMLKFDAFRVTGHKPPTGFRTPLDCEYEPNDIVPIAVGVALAVLVIVVLIAYIVGRRRNQQRG